MSRPSKETRSQKLNFKTSKGDYDYDRQTLLSGGFKDFLFSRLFGEDSHIFPFWRAYFSIGLKPPTRLPFIVDELLGSEASEILSWCLCSSIVTPGAKWSNLTRAYVWNGWLTPPTIKISRSNHKDFLLRQSVRGPTLSTEIVHHLAA